MAVPPDYRKFFRASDLSEQVLEGGVRRVVYTGEKLQLVEYHFPAGRVFEPHSHGENEQMGYLVSWRMGFRVGDEERVLGPGDYYHAPVGVVHNAWTFDEPAVLLDVFGPPRDDL